MSQSSYPRPSSAATTVVWLSLLMSGVVYAVVAIALVTTRVVPPEGFVPEMPPPISLVFLIAGLLPPVAAIPVHRALQKRLRVATPNNLPDLRALIVAMAMAEFGSLMGLVSALCTAQLGTSYLLWGVSFAVAVTLYPSQSANTR